MSRKSDGGRAGRSYLGSDRGPELCGSQQTHKTMNLFAGRRARCSRYIPELAQKMNISGTVKIEVVVAPNGTVKRRAGGGRASGAGQCGAGCGKEVAF